MSAAFLFSPRYAINYDFFVILQGMISQQSRQIPSCQSQRLRVRPTRSEENQGKRGFSMELVRRFWCDQQGQDIAEYAVMLAVILVIVVGTVRLIGSNANNVFSSVASSIQ